MNRAICFTPLLAALKLDAETLLVQAGLPQQHFNVAMVNVYHKGHKIGMHSDDNPEIVPNSSIVSFSFGACRF